MAWLFGEGLSDKIAAIAIFVGVSAILGLIRHCLRNDKNRPTSCLSHGSGIVTVKLLPFEKAIKRYFDDAKLVLGKVATANGLNARLFDTAIFDFVRMKRAIQEGMAPDFNEQYSALWKEVQSFVRENS
jgi:hypothetical protein